MFQITKIKDFFYKKFFHYPKFWNKVNFISLILYPLSFFTFIIYYLRNTLTKKYKFNSKLICIGNVTVGGTGKTPLIRYVAKNLLENNYKIAIISKGYGYDFSDAFINIKDLLINRKNFISTEKIKNIPDEAIEILNYLSKYNNDKNFEIFISKSPKNLIEHINDYNPDLILLDDFMQNPSILKDLTILCIDGDRLLGNNFMIPAGPLRQNFSSINNSCNMVVISNASNKLVNQFENIIKDKDIFNAKYVLKSDINKEESYYAMTAIGNPEKFFNFLRKNNILIKREIFFPDHYYFNEEDILSIQNQMKNDNLKKILVTSKDYVKLKDFVFDVEFIEVVIDLEINQNFMNNILKLNGKN